MLFGFMLIVVEAKRSYDTPAKGREKTAGTTDYTAYAIYLARRQSYCSNINRTRKVQPDNFTPANPLVDCV